MFCSVGRGTRRAHEVNLLKTVDELAVWIVCRIARSNLESTSESCELSAIFLHVSVATLLGLVDIQSLPHHVRVIARTLRVFAVLEGGAGLRVHLR
jgi:hypothetical protein